MPLQDIYLEGRIHAVDHETIGQNQRKTELIFGRAVVNNDEIAVDLLHARVGVGGEVRAELDLYVKAVKDGHAVVTGIARLFEGTSEDTDDLEDEHIIDLFVPNGRGTKGELALHNHETKSKDYATFDFTITNKPTGVVLTSGGGLYGSLPKQDQWRYCIRCGGLWFAGGSTSGRCPAGGGHTQNGSGNYMLVDSVSFAHGQPNWRFCHRCCGLWFGGAGHTGRCPAGNGHSATGSGNYVLTESTTVTGQRDWRWCEQCLGLWFHGRMGRCPRGGGHSLIGSGDYVLTGNL